MNSTICDRNMCSKRTCASDDLSCLTYGCLDRININNTVPDNEDVLYTAVIEIAPITKKNSQRIMYVKNKTTGIERRWIGQSAAYTKYAKSARNFLFNPPHIEEEVNVAMGFYIPKNSRTDLSNLISACLDILVENGVLADDNQKIVATQDGSFVKVDPDHPRTEILITRKKNNEWVNELWKGFGHEVKK